MERSSNRISPDNWPLSEPLENIFSFDQIVAPREKNSSSEEQETSDSEEKHQHPSQEDSREHNQDKLLTVGLRPYFLLLGLLAMASLTWACNDEPPVVDDDPVICEAGTGCPCLNPWDCPLGETCQDGICLPFATDASRDPDMGQDLPTDFEDSEEDPLEDLELDLEDEDPQDVEPETIEPVCEDDRFDQPTHPTGNDTKTRAIRLEAGLTSDLVSCPGDPDWWLYSVPAHNLVTFQVLTEHPLNLHLETSTGTATGQLVEDELGYTITTTTRAADTLYLRILSAEPPLRVEYSIFIDAGRIACIDDEFDGEFASNNRREDAAQLSPGTHALVFCDYQGEADWFSFDGRIGTWADIRLTFDSQEIGGTLFAHLYREGVTNPINTGTAESNRHLIESVALSNARYEIHVNNTPTLAEGSYQLTIELSDMPDCAYPDGFDTAFEPNNTQEQALSQPITFQSDGSMVDATSYQQLIMCEDDLADIYAINLSERSLIEIEIDFTYSTLPMRGWVYFQGAAPEERTPLVPNPDGFFFSLYTPLARTVFIRLEPSLADERIFYSLAARRSTCVFDALELNNEPDQAYLFPAGTVNQSGLRLCPVDNTIDWYRRQVNPYRNQSITIQNQGSHPLSVNLFHGSIQPLTEQCSQDAECELGQWCLGQRGCAQPVLSEVVPASSLGELEYSTGAASGDYLLAVSADSLTANLSYNLGWLFSFACPSDPFGNNHSVLTAFEVDPALSPLEGGTVCVLGVQEEDYFEVKNLPADTILNVSLLFPPGDTLQLQMPCGSTAVTSDTGTLSRSTIIGTGPSNLCFRVKGMFTANPAAAVIPYKLFVSSSTPLATCQADRFEPNNSAASRAIINSGQPWVDDLIMLEDLTLCAGDLDFFEISALRGDRITVDALFDASLGELGLRLHGPCVGASCPGDPLATSSQTNAVERLAHTVTENGTYALEVFAREAVSNQTYALAIAIHFECSYADDPYEPNDNPGQAASPAPGASWESLELCASPSSPHQPDYDWFLYNLNIGDILVADLLAPHYHGDLDMVLWYDSVAVAESRTDQDSKQLEFVAMQPGQYLLEVFSADGSNTPYELRVVVERLPCPPDRMSPNHEPARAVELRTGYYPGLRLCHDQEDWFKIVVEEEMQLAVMLVADPYAPSDDLLLDIFGPHQDPLTDTPLASSLPARALDLVRLPSSAPGNYLLRVRQADQLLMPPSYDLTVLLADPDTCPFDLHQPNDSAETATRLYSHSRLAAFACNDDWYLVDLFAEQELKVNLYLAATSSVRPLMRLYDDPTGAPIGSASGHEVRLTAAEDGPIYLEVSPEGSELGYLLLFEVGDVPTSCDPELEPNPDIPPLDSARALVGPAFDHLCGEAQLWSLNASANQDVRLELLLAPRSSPPEVTPLDRFGNPLDHQLSRVGDRLELWFTAPAAGTHYILLSDFDNHYLGPYRLEATLFSVIPVDTHDTPGHRNDTLAEATSIAPTGLGQLLSPNPSLSPYGDVDFYAFAAQAGRRVQVLAEALVGEVVLRLYAPGGVLVGESNLSSADYPKEGLWMIAETTGTYYAEVFNHSLVPSRYRLLLINAALTSCTDAGTNRSVDTAASVNFGGPYPHTVCAGADDWYRTGPSLNPGQNFFIEVNHQLANADLDIEVFDDAGNLLHTRRTLSTPERVEVIPLTSGRISFRVFVDDGSPGGSYQLSINFL